MKKLIIFLIFVFSLNLAYADLTIDNQAYYSFDINSFLDSSVNGNDATNFGTTNITGVIKDGRLFDGSNDYVSSGYTTSSTNGDEISISLWAKRDTTGTNDVLVFKGNDFDFNNYELTHFSDNKIKFRYVGTDASINTYTPTSTLSDTGVWHYITFTHTFGTPASTKLYIDSVLQSGSWNGGSISPRTDSNPLVIGQGYTSTGVTTNMYGGSLDEVSIYNKTLSQSEISQLYNNGTGFNPYTTTPSQIQFTSVKINNQTLNSSNIFATNELNGTVEITVNATNPNVNQTYTFKDILNQTVATQQYATNSLNGSFTLNLSSGLYTMELFAENNETNATSESYQILIDVDPPSLNVTLPKEYNFYNGFNFSQYINVSDTAKALDFCIVGINGVNVTTCDEENYNFTLAENKTINIFAQDTAGNINVSLNNIMLVNPFAYFNVQATNTTPLTDFTLGGRSDNSTGTVTYKTFNDGLNIGSNTLSFVKSGYQTQNIQFNLTNTSPQFNETYIVQDAVINIFIRDRETNALVTGVNFSIEFIASVGLVTSTTTGTKSITNTLFQEENYQVVISADNYTTESTFFFFTNKEELDVTLHTSQDTDLKLGVVDVKVVDKFGKAIEGAIVQALQWNSETSSFQKVSEGLTAENGRSLLNVILDTELYIFNAQFQGLTKNTSQQFIPELLNGKEIVISLDEGPTSATGLFENVIYDIEESFNKTSYVSDIAFTWNNKDGTDITGCIIYSRIQPSGTKTQLSKDCSTGSVVVDLSVSKQLNSSFYILAEVGFLQGGLFYEQETFKYNPIFDVSNILKETNLALYILPLLYLVSVFIGMLNPMVGAVTLILVNIAGLYLIPQYLTGKIVAFMYFIAVMIMYAGGKRK